METRHRRREAEMRLLAYFTKWCLWSVIGICMSSREGLKEEDRDYIFRLSIIGLVVLGGPFLVACAVKSVGIGIGGFLGYMFFGGLVNYGSLRGIRLFELEESPKSQLGLEL